MGHPRGLRITAKFILWFLIISLLPLALSIYISYNSSRRILRKEVTNSLLVVADTKADQVESYLANEKKSVATLSNMPGVLDALEKISDAFRGGGAGSEAYSAAIEQFKPMLAYYQRSFGYDDIILINSEGEIIFSVSGTKAAKSVYETALYSSKKSELLNVFMRAKESQETEISDFEYRPQAKKADIFIATPIFNGADLLGVVVVQGSNRELCRFAQDYTSLGETGETIIAAKAGGDAVVIVPLRFDPEAAFKKKIQLGSDEEPDLQKAIQGEKGSGVAVDYRGQEVWSAWRFLPTCKWGMAVKMDTAEIFGSARKLRNTLLTISLLLLLLVVTAALLIARSISRPIRELTRTSKTISAGELGARAQVITNDEIGELAHSFNLMTDTLVEAKRNVEQKKTELEEQKRLLEEVNKELDNFVYTVSHDLRAPLRGIEGFTTFLEQDYADKLDRQGRDYLGRIRGGTVRMKALIDDLLTLSRISRIKNPYEDVDMNALAASIVKRIEFDIREKKVELKVARDLPIVHCDRIKIEEVFLNLLTNAVKFSSKKKDSTPVVEIGYNDREAFHEFFVKDNGIGIDKKYHEEIFVIFKRLQTQEEYEGTGAGLSIVKRVINDHKGSVWIDSEPGKGATFYFTIPKELQTKKKLGEILLEGGRISEKDLKEALKKQGAEEKESGWGTAKEDDADG